MHSFVVRLTFAGPAINENPDRSNVGVFHFSAVRSTLTIFQSSSVIPCLSRRSIKKMRFQTRDNTWLRSLIGFSTKES